MCLCESTALVNEPLSVLASAEQHSCSEPMENLASEPRDCIISDSSGDSTGNRYDDTVIYLEENRGGSDGDSAGYSYENHCENVDCSGLKELLGARIDDHVACLNVSQSKIDVHNSENDQLCLENRLFSGKYVPTAINGSLGLSQDEYSACLSSGTEIETEICNRIQSVKDSNLTLESIAIAGCRSGCAQQNGQNDNNIVRGPLLDGKNCASSMIKSVTSSEISAICCAQTLSSLQGSGDSVSSCDWLNQKDDMSSRDLSLKSFNKAVETKSIGDTYSELLASKGCVRSFETLHRAESLCTKQNAQTDNKNFIVLSGDSVAKVSEERTDIAEGAKVETSSEIMNAGDSFELSENSLCDKLVPLSCHPFDIVENGLSGRLDPPDCLTKGAYAALNSSSSIDFCGQRQNEGKVVVKADCVSEIKHHPTESSSSRRGGRKGKSSQKTNAKTRNCRNKLQQPPETIELHFRASRRKRSCSSRPGRSSIQGLFSNITQFLGPCDDPEFNEVQNQKPSNARDGQGSRKSCKDQSGQSIKGSGGLSKSATSCLRFRIKVGKGVGPSNLNSVVAEVVNLPVSVDTSFSIYGKGTGLQFPKLGNVAEDKVGELGIERQFLNKEDQEKVKTCLDASFMDLKLTNNFSGSAEYLKKSAEDALGDYLVSKPNAVAESSGRAIDNKYSGSGTSPDSVVINSIPDAQASLIHQEELHDPVLNNSGFLASPGGVKSSKVSKKGKKDNHRSPHTVCLRKPKSSNNCRGRTKTRDNEFISNKAISSSAGANSSRGNGLGVSEEAMKMDINMDAKACCSHHVSETKKFKNLSSSKYTPNQLSKSSKSQGVRKGSKIKVKEKDSNQEIVTRGGKHPLTGNHISDDFENSDTVNSSASAYMINIDSVSDVIKQHTQPDNAWVCCDDCHKWRRIPVTLLNSIDEACRWICGENADKTFADCSIPQEKSNADINAELGVSDAEEDGCDGLNYKEFEKGFNNKRVTVPPPSHFWRIDSNKFLHRGCKTQTIDEIMICHCKRPPDGNLGCGDECLNRMLNIECVQDTCPCGELCSNQQFQKRKYAKMMWDRFGRKGFGLRMLENISAGQFLIEYVGEVLDMQVYEARQKEYASRGQRHFYFMTLNGSEVIDAYVKGNLGRFINHSCDPNCRTEKWMVNGEICIGLFALRDIKKGEEITFDYNYVRVVGAAAKKCHCGSSHCRGYIGGDSLSEGVIVYDDSDEESPEPMMLEDGETWNGYANVISRYSRFVGAEMQPVERVITDVVRKLEKMPEAEGSVYHSASASSKVDISAEIEDLQGNFQLPIQPEEVSPLTAPCEAVQQDDTIEQKAMKKTSRLIHILDTSLNMSDNKLSSVIIDVNKESKFNTAEDKQVPPKSHPLMKTSCLSSSHKKGKLSSNSLIGTKVRMISDKSQVPSFKLKKFSETSSSCRFEAVEEKLNELLDSEGGITKRKDASKGYLKLLLLTATSGDSCNGEAIQSTRELSMILDALLKTKSRLVLTDIIDKNGLQMLHNIMKKYRRDFNKIPVLRKLLKVLEYLARRKILTVERINGGPPCAGRESFLESILSFTEHNDKTVHEIARNFRDTWIPKPLRKHSYRDKVERRMELRRYLDCNRVSASHNHLRDQAIRSTEAITVVETTTLDTSHEICSSSPTGVCQTNGTKIRKRKSRWDQPAETEKIDSRSPKKHEYSQLTILGKPTSNHMNKMRRWDKECHDILCKGEAVNVVNGRHRFQGDAPPGFSSLCSASLVSSTAALTATSFTQPKTCQLKCPEMTIAHPQTRLISRLPVSYGIPLPIVQQFGAPKDESVECWVIAPGMPFHPYPPLPPSPCPHGKKDIPPVCDANSIGNNEDAKDEQQDCCRPATSYPDNSIRSTAHCNEPNSEIPCANIQRTSKRTRESSNDLGKYFRQQKRKGPLWHNSESTGSKHNNIGGTSFLDVGNVKNDVRNS
ncbi:histone-lysine N-methyltransferase ASHH2 isoform X1 [Gossypium australe]|uniref:Histone-lysine N-methyltransferase ASHH2 isoform X1 n=1 Tax=Gossypium australe TaxID=47621 RepID=A0A5B6U783_9ROSI|nr:histone-lysine N-methyltransferase ASHH2 isoform X1 [Gossypium australe]